MIDTDEISAVVEKHCCDGDFYEGVRAAAREISRRANEALNDEREKLDALALKYLNGLARTCYLAERHGTLGCGQVALLPAIDRSAERIDTECRNRTLTNRQTSA
jgi:hypothetical protein